MARMVEGHFIPVSRWPKKRCLVPSKAESAAALAFLLRVSSPWTMPVSYADADTGLSVEARARMLVTHADSEYEEWGASASVRLAPGERGRGLSFSLSPTLGAAVSGAERLWGARRATDLAQGGGFEAARGLQGEIGYGLSAFGDRFTGTPNLGFGFSDSAREYRMGWRLTSAVRGDPGFEVNLDATRREAVNDNGNVPPEHGVMLRAAIRW